MSTTTVYSVHGMTCGHCVSSVESELRKLPGVTEVAIDLVAGGDSPVAVTSDNSLDEAAVREAVDEAGYELIGSTG